MIKTSEEMRRLAAALRVRALRADDLDKAQRGELLQLASEWQQLAAELEAERSNPRCKRA